MQKLEACPVCGGRHIAEAYVGHPGRTQWSAEGTFSVWRCADCAHTFLNPQPDEETLLRCYSSQYSAYSKGHGADDLTKAKDEAKQNKSFRHVDLHEDMSVLDVGCGSGTFLYIIKDVVGSVYGIEPSEHGVKTCSELGVPAFHGDFEAFHETSNDTFDLITLNHVVEHHPDPLRLISLCRSHLNPGGRIWISVPNAGSFFARKLKSNWHSSDIPVHLQHFNAASLRLALESSGLKVEVCRTESENSLPISVGMLMRRVGIPRRVSEPLVSRALSKSGWLGKRIDASGQGEALIISAVI